MSEWNTVLIVTNILIYIIVNIISRESGRDHLVLHGALYWPAIVHTHEYYRLLTYMFLHANITHLSNNMLVLFFLGDNLERAAGKWRFLVLYFGSGIIAGLVSMYYNMVKHYNVISVGASGAIFGVVGAMVNIVIRNKGRLENISARQMVLFVIFSLYGGLTSQGVDNAAHIGGLISGFLLAGLLYRKPKKVY
ncbi:MAG: rhomboid family intramembrane serine protease [Clostridiales bacterium]|nr:rhomboid family intramembrane serine protease [Clostridiales bacterium]